MNIILLCVVGVCALAYLAIPLTIAAAKAGLLDQMGIGIFTEVRAVENGYGLFVDKVQPNTPAAGVIEAGDRVLEVDGIPILASSAEKAARLRDTMTGKLGTLMNVTVDRRGNAITHSLRRQRLRFLEIPVD